MPSMTPLLTRRRCTAGHGSEGHGQGVEDTETANQRIALLEFDIVLVRLWAMAEPLSPPCGAGRPGCRSSPLPAVPAGRDVG